MIFSEKLQFIRKNHGFTQEELAGKLNVSRQAVAKWESGQVYSDIFNLIQISNLFHVTVDYLVKDQDCTVQCTNEMKTDIEKLIRFCLEANKNTYAPHMNRVDSTSNSEECAVLIGVVNSALLLTDVLFYSFNFCTVIKQYIFA